MGKLTTQERMNIHQRRIIVHSYIYYELDNNIVSDKQYDKWCRELVEMKNQFPDLWENSEYFKQFGSDYNGSTGFTLYHELNDHQKEIIQSIASLLLRQSRLKQPEKKRKKGERKSGNPKS